MFGVAWMRGVARWQNRRSDDRRGGVPFLRDMVAVGLGLENGLGTLKRTEKQGYQKTVNGERSEECKKRGVPAKL